MGRQTDLEVVAATEADEAATEGASPPPHLARLESTSKTSTNVDLAPPGWPKVTEGVPMPQEWLEVGEGHSIARPWIGQLWHRRTRRKKDWGDGGGGVGKAPDAREGEKVVVAASPRVGAGVGLVGGEAPGAPISCPSSSSSSITSSAVSSITLAATMFSISSAFLLRKASNSSSFIFCTCSVREALVMLPITATSP